MNAYEKRRENGGYTIIKKGTDMSFGSAFDLICIHSDYYMRLPHWKEDVKIKVQRPDKNSKMTAPYLYVESRFGRVPWRETEIELFSNNWEIYQELAAIPVSNGTVKDTCDCINGKCTCKSEEEKRNEAVQQAFKQAAETISNAIRQSTNYASGSGCLFAGLDDDVFRSIFLGDGKSKFHGDDRSK